MVITKHVVLFLLVILSVTEAKPEYHRMKGHFGPDVAFQDVMIDEEEQLVVATVAKITSKKVTPTIGYHDIAEGFSVIKLVEMGICYIEKGLHTIEDFNRLILEAEQDGGNYEYRQVFNCKSKTPVEQSEVAMNYGERIAAFCKDYKSIFIVNEYKKRSKRNVYGFTGNAMGCLFCAGICL